MIRFLARHRHLITGIAVTGLIVLLVYMAIKTKDLKIGTYNNKTYSGIAFGTAIKKTIFAEKDEVCDKVDYDIDNILKSVDEKLSYREHGSEIDVLNNSYAVGGNSVYENEIASMHTGDCSNTDFGKVMELLSHLDGNMPEYLVVLSDMEFDRGSSKSKDETMRLFKSKGYTTKIVWWNLNSRNTTSPEMDDSGNIFLSGYNPMLLKFPQAGFDGNKFLYTLLREYAKCIEA